jgi:hypothetical protein
VTGATLPTIWSKLARARFTASAGPRSLKKYGEP